MTHDQRRVRKYLKDYMPQTIGPQEIALHYDMDWNQVKTICQQFVDHGYAVKTKNGRYKWLSQKFTVVRNYV